MARHARPDALAANEGAEEVGIVGDAQRGLCDRAIHQLGEKQRCGGAFVTIPLDLRDVHGLAALSMITAVIPGTVWCELAPDCSALRLHVFDLPDEANFIAHYKADYELPLKEIFG